MFNLCETYAMSDLKKKKSVKAKTNGVPKNKSVTLKQLAADLKLSPTSVSLVLNAAPTAGSIPPETQERIFAAARKFNYRPNYIARSLRVQRTHTIGVLIPELSGGYSATVLSGVEDELLERDYFYLIGSHRHKPKFIDRYAKFFLERCVEGILAIDTPQINQTFLPAVSISGHEKISGVTNIELNHESAAKQLIEYFVEMNHRKLAIIKGQDFSSDTEVRCHSMLEVAKTFGISIEPDLISQLVGNDPSPETGYAATKKLLASGKEFTALLAFNDISAIGAIRALREANLRVPEDVSVSGFDDVDVAKFHNPALTTIRQPLFEMGKLAARTLLDTLTDSAETATPEILTVEPQLIIRQSTAPVKT